ncbi:TIR domain-containing protein [Paenibacillus lautus]|uniref:SEFIR domain-containing protein n=1 Tax=Paenibacillus lautus TaxID=1401 RepID=UPI00203AEFCE|nr:SEFIR domain-containing protein [Paenibacillus lautus]MCM3257023.1 TIR domain-containing protein [Paenibacillus lautus]
MSLNPNTKPPTVFISYSWTTPEHEQWVYDLAERLMAGDGVDVKLDKWDLKEGYDKFAFMESMVTSDNIDKVLVICDKGYQEKANANKGGVGTEKILITPEVLQNVEQTKVIPIVSERDENGKEYMPNFIKSRIYIDLSNSDSFEENYEKLIRLLYNAPLYRKPSLGKKPVFLDEEKMNNYRSSNMLRQLTKATETNPQRLKSLAIGFSEVFLEELEQLKIEYEEIKTNEIDDVITDRINSSLPLRDNYLEIVKVLIENDRVESDWFINLYEKMYSFTEFKGSGNYNELQFDQYKFLVHEMYIYTIGLLVKYEKFPIVHELLSSEYLLDSVYRNNGATFETFRFHLPSLEIRNERLGMRKISFHAHLLMERINTRFLTKPELIDCDLLLFYLSSLIIQGSYKWFPITYIYREYGARQIRCLVKLKSKRVAAKSISLFGASSIEEMKERISNYKHDSDYRYRNHHYPVPSLHVHIKPDEIAINP